MLDCAGADSGLHQNIASTEELREALVTLRRQNELLAQGGVQAQTLLDALESLLALQPEADPFHGVFTALRKVFSFSGALMLAEPEPGPEGEAAPALDRVECIVADPALLQGSVWPVDALFRKVMAGKVVATFSNASAAEWRQMAEGDSAQALWLRGALELSALHVPVRARAQRGVLILLRPREDGGFGRGDVALAQRFSLLVSHALASRYASQTQAEGRRLRELTEQLRSSEQATRRTAELLQTLMSVLPVGVAVQDGSGQLLLTNDAIAPALGVVLAGTGGAVHPPPGLPSGVPSGLPFDLRAHTEADARRRRKAFEEHLASGEQRSGEYAVSSGGRPRTLLVTGKPVRMLDDTMLVSTALDITDRKRLEQDLSHRAFHDPLTGLPNRVRMKEIVDRAVRRHASGGGMFALAFIDLDSFKQVNDYYSHALGDSLLRAVAERVTQHIRGDDTLARISGDEFLLLIDPLNCEADLPPLIDRVIEALKQPFLIEGHELMMSASMGASLYPRHGDTYEELCRAADGAMYRAKRDRKGSASYFDHSMAQALTARMETEQQLRAAIRERRFRIAFQSKLGLRSRQVVGLEALVRWVDQDGTVHLPGSFIELASELGLLDRITEFVVDQVAEHLPALSRRFGPKVSVSINVSARQAGDPAFMDGLIERLQHLGIAQRVMLELTEDALLATQRFVRDVLPRLRAAGLRLSIDDFGTGYSSLAMLADMTVDEVKVDRSLISAIHQRQRSQSILRAIESLCAGLGAALVAEGVETREELDYLSRHSRISVVQGYFFMKPQFIDALLQPADGAAADVI